MEYKVKYTDDTRVSIAKENEKLGFRVGATETYPDGVTKEFTFTDYFPTHPVPEDFKVSYDSASTTSDKLAVISRFLGLV